MDSEDVTIDLDPGSYDFICRFHAQMTGTLTVDLAAGLSARTRGSTGTRTSRGRTPEPRVLGASPRSCHVADAYPSIPRSDGHPLDPQVVPRVRDEERGA